MDEGLEAEEQRLKAVIQEAQARLSELQEYRRLRAKFIDLEKPVSAAQVLAKLAYEGKLVRPKVHGDTLRERVILGCQLILDDGKRRLSRELLPELASMGVHVGGADPASNLSVYLSREKELFSSDVKQGGWTLVHLAKTARPADVAASAGLLFNDPVNRAV